ncbi:hypothetical protein [Rhizobium sp. P28RR-XV]|uniref:hypothetical protein n=1 Tax=Rhizobium sp. P28RR-XV TaxID=2726737 RepID=UPI001FEF728F|nr:hypothetical protein [Rhizobium sp. P28RR-XV]
MKLADKARERADRHVFEIIPDSVGGIRPSVRRSVINSVPNPGSQAFLAKDDATGIVLAHSRDLRASLGSDWTTRDDAPVWCLVIDPAGVDSPLTWSEARTNFVVAILRDIPSELARQEFDHGNVEYHSPVFGTVDPVALGIAHRIFCRVNRESNFE